MSKFVSATLPQSEFRQCLPPLKFASASLLSPNFVKCLPLQSKPQLNSSLFSPELLQAAHLSRVWRLKVTKLPSSGEELFCFESCILDQSTLNPEVLQAAHLSRVWRLKVTKLPSSGTGATLLCPSSPPRILVFLKKKEWGMHVNVGSF